MIRIFKPTETSFQSNGEKVIQPQSATVHKEDNGDYYLELKTDLTYAEYLTPNNLIVVDLPQGAQAFRITTVNATRKTISLKAYHVFYDSKNYLIADSYVVNKNANACLDHLNDALDNVSPFVTISDITLVGSYRCVRKTFYEAIKEVIERWGGHLVRDNFTIGLRANIGADNGVTIRYGKNLTEIKASYDWSNVCTKLLPEGDDGVMLDEIYVYSSQQYELPYTKTVKFEQKNIIKDDYKTADGKEDEEKYKHALKTDLYQKAVAYLEENSTPLVTYETKAVLDHVTDIGDTVEVIDERLGINVTTHVVSFEYDCVSNRYTSVALGNAAQTLAGFAQNVSKQITSATDQAQQSMRVTLSSALEKATSNIWGALAESNVIYEGNRILIVDRLPKENANNVILINSQGIGFSSTGINGTFNSAWTIDGTMNMEHINVINLTADLIKGGTLKLGSNLNEQGTIEIYDDWNNLVGLLDSNGVKVYGRDGGYVLMNREVGFAGYDYSGRKIFWSDQDEFHTRKAVVEEEITIGSKIRFLNIDSGNSHGVGIVSVEQN